ncbi:hypothetical protein ACFFX1_29090 [Dactylosporangium sucinum]|uniref:Uncharacterized protein n=1 Tax=Dactylosporangium sucinum TaxID=1424081 RepID=A0A917X2L0_9ACTN|nr:hypothetical protein [Dactylosporangium sucinum]GGM57015.1 hypothetical protein GCM10007977_068400 [Dactylosporangium sucinum]
MAKWAVVVSPEQYESERLYGADSLAVPGVGDSLDAGDEVLLVAGVDEPVVFGLARADGRGGLRYTVNLLEAPLPAPGIVAAVEEGGALGAHAVDERAFRDIQQRVRPVDTVRRTWLVSVDLPIEAASPGEAVRAFWNYVRELGPAELPAFVWPAGDELAMQAFVLGAEANQDPEED